MAQAGLGAEAAWKDPVANENMWTVFHYYHIAQMFSLQLTVQLDYTAGAMFLQMYSFLMLIYDVVSLIFLIIEAELEAFYHIFIPPRMKCVTGEIILVCHYVWVSIHIYREDFYFVDPFHGRALNGDRCAACCDAHTNFADESACLTADDVRNECKFLPLFTDHRRC
jgi:hypothetical protein